MRHYYWHKTKPSVQKALELRETKQPPAVLVITCQRVQRFRILSSLIARVLPYTTYEHGRHASRPRDADHAPPSSPRLQRSAPRCSVRIMAASA